MEAPHSAQDAPPQEGLGPGASGPGVPAVVEAPRALEREVGLGKQNRSSCWPCDTRNRMSSMFSLSFLAVALWVPHPSSPPSLPGQVRASGAGIYASNGGTCPGTQRLSNKQARFRAMSTRASRFSFRCGSKGNSFWWIPAPRRLRPAGGPSCSRLPALSLGPASPTAQSPPPEAHGEWGGGI